jgi:hypothetical protein
MDIERTGRARLTDRSSIAIHLEVARVGLVNVSTLIKRVFALACQSLAGVRI